MDDLERLRARRRLSPGLLGNREGMASVADRVFVDDTTEERFQELVRLGFNCLQAETLAVSGCTMHDARELIRRGCKHDLAFDILSD